METNAVKIQVLSVKDPEMQEPIDRVLGNMGVLQEIAQKHGIRALLVSPYLGEGDYDLTFGIRMRDDSYDRMRCQKFSREVEENSALALTSVNKVHSPDNPYIRALDLVEPYVDRLGESLLTQEDIIRSREKSSSDHGKKANE